MFSYHGTHWDNFDSHGVLSVVTMTIITTPGSQKLSERQLTKFCVVTRQITQNCQCGNLDNNA